MIQQGTIREIQQRTEILDVVGEFVKLKRRGASYLGLCPFHNEKTPSFTVSPSREIFKCFGCGRSGDAITFLREHEKYSFEEALRWLANRYGIEVGETDASPEYKLRQQVADSLFILNQFAQQWFSRALIDSSEGQEVGLTYLEERRFNPEIIRKFQLGYCPDAPGVGNAHDAFARAALAAKYNPELLLKSGLVVQRYDQPQDNYRGRIIFPIHNQTGKVLGFGARLIRNNDKAPKYINTPENEIYVKSKILYGLYFARQAVDKADECLLVEGYTDVISLHQAGVENVVASGGTSLTTDQLRLIKKYTDNLTIVYDGDAAGIKAALRGLDMALEERLYVRLVLIPDGDDPDSYVRKVGAAAFREFVAAGKKDFILFQLDIALRDAAGDAQKKAVVVNQIAETLSKINQAEDFTRRNDYIRRCSQLLNIDEAGLNNLVNKFLREKVGKVAQPHSAPGQTTSAQAAPGLQAAVAAATPPDNDALDLFIQDEANERALIRALLEFGDMPWEDGLLVADYVFSEFDDGEIFENKDLYRIYALYRTWHRQGLKPNAKSFLYYEDRDLNAIVIGLTAPSQHQVSDRWSQPDEDLSYEPAKAGYRKHLGRDYVKPEDQTAKDHYKIEVRSPVNYLQLKKIKKLILQNHADMEKPQTPEQYAVLMDTHLHLKELERELTRQVGTVILK